MDYDPTIIRKFASALYRRADGIVMSSTILGALVGLVTGGILLHVIGAVIGGLLVGAIGYSWGSQRAFSLRLEAQVALCQVQIEENTQRYRA